VFAMALFASVVPLHRLFKAHAPNPVLVAFAGMSMLLGMVVVLWAILNRKSIADE